MSAQGVVRWEQGRSTIDAMIGSRELESVKADRRLADLLLTHAAGHLSGSTSILDVDPIGSLSLAYDAAHKAFTAVLENQGLRATMKGGHKAVEDAMRAQLVPPLADLVNGFGWMRLVRHASKYVTFERASATSDDARRAIAIADLIVRRSAGLLDVMPRY